MKVKSNRKVYLNLSRSTLSWKNIKSLDDEDYRKECDNFIIRSFNLEMYLQKLKKSTI